MAVTEIASDKPVGICPHAKARGEAERPVVLTLESMDEVPARVGDDQIDAPGAEVARGYGRRCTASGEQHRRQREKRTATPVGQDRDVAGAYVGDGQVDASSLIELA